MDKVGDLSEGQLIHQIIAILGQWGNEIMEGSDDAVAIPGSPTPNHALVVNSDMLVSTTDIPPQMTLFQAARKAVIMACSDVLVKGAIPQWAVVSLGVPASLPMKTDQGFLGMIRGLKEGFEHCDVAYLGGDLSQTLEIVINITCMGYLERERIIHRSGAHPGDLIYTSGEYGLTGLGFHFMLNSAVKVPHNFDFKACEQAVLNPTTPLSLGPDLALQGVAHASADSSDGLVKTLAEIAHASHVGILIEWMKIPIHPSVTVYAQLTGEDIKDFVLSGGEEFHHIFIVPPEHQRIVEMQFSSQLKQIGLIVEKTEGFQVRLTKNSYVPFSNIKSGYDHFTLAINNKK
jgi:thiamine-monophosphate kinase